MSDVVRDSSNILICTQREEGVSGLYRFLLKKQNKQKAYTNVHTNIFEKPLNKNTLYIF